MSKSRFVNKRVEIIYHVSDCIRGLKKRVRESVNSVTLSAGASLELRTETNKLCYSS